MLFQMTGSTMTSISEVLRTTTGRLTVLFQISCAPAASKPEPRTRKGKVNVKFTGAVQGTSSLINGLGGGGLAAPTSVMVKVAAFGAAKVAPLGFRRDNKTVLSPSANPSLISGTSKDLLVSPDANVKTPFTAT